MRGAAREAYFDRNRRIADLAHRSQGQHSMTLSLKALALAAFAAAGPASATVMVYTSQADFDAAAPTATTFGFDGHGTTTFEPNPFSIHGLSFRDDVTPADTLNGGQPSVIVVSAAKTPTYGQDFLSYQNENVGILSEIDSAGTYAIGFSYGDYVFAGPSTVTLNTGDSFAISPTTTPQFIGFTSTAPITSVMIDSPGGYDFDLLTVSTIAAVPEPAMWALMLVGFGGVGGAIRARRSRTLATA
jgi:hypothetical protein